MNRKCKQKIIKEGNDEVYCIKRKPEKRVEYGTTVTESHGWGKIAWRGHGTDSVIRSGI
jgi:hypothetical protein